LSSTPRAVRLEVRDDGVGFAAEAADREQGGLRNMISRASEMGAHLQITSAAGSGTIVVLRLPKIESYRK
jgi:two-component system sensor kinase FixL